MTSIEKIIQQIHQVLSNHFSINMVLFLESVFIILAIIVFFSMLGIFLVYMERKIAAFMQIRIGPNRVGPWGTLQTLADTLKLVLKENFTPKESNRFLFNFAPILSIIVSTIIIAPLAFAKNSAIWDINIGILFVAAFSSISILSILIAGWSSGNKFALLGAMRSGAQIISYEISGGFAILTIVILSQSMQFSEIIKIQENGWWIFKGHLPVWIAFFIFMISSTAECNRAPFDLAEAESELTAGFHTEYGGMKFALFFLSEYINVFVLCAIGATLFLGGWMPLHIGNFAKFNHIMDFIPSSIWFFSKTFFLIFCMMWFRWTFPRLRIDQLLRLEWKYLLPIGLFNLLLTTLIAINGWHF